MSIGKSVSHYTMMKDESNSSINEDEKSTFLHREKWVQDGLSHQSVSTFSWISTMHHVMGKIILIKIDNSANDVVF